MSCSCNLCHSCSNARSLTSLPQQELPFSFLTLFLFLAWNLVIITSSSTRMGCVCESVKVWTLFCYSFPGRWKTVCSQHNAFCKTSNLGSGRGSEGEGISQGTWDGTPPFPQCCTHGPLCPTHVLEHLCTVMIFEHEWPKGYDSHNQYDTQGDSVNLIPNELWHSSLNFSRCL